MMKFREKLLDFKQRLSQGKMYSIMVIIIVFIAGWGIYQYKLASNFRQELDNQYNRAFFDMTGYVQNVESLLLKAMVSNSSVKTVQTLKEASRQANLAQENLGQLPISQIVLSNTSRFLTQVGDLSYSLGNQYANGKSISDEQFSILKKLNSVAMGLRNNLADLQRNLTSGRMKWGFLAKKGATAFEKTSSDAQKGDVESLDKTFQDYPTLIYDGPFSDHMSNIKPRGVTGKSFSIEEAKSSVYKVFGRNRVSKISAQSKNNIGSIPTYSYTVILNTNFKSKEANISITQKGAHPIWMLYDRETANKSLNMDQAKAKGKDFLELIGFSNMTDSYYLSEDGTATINYAYEDRGVVMYPDLIKVKIALDTGEIVGFECKSYLTAHTVRNLGSPKLSMADARSLVNPKLDITKAGLAVIPTEFQTELYVYEFKGRLDKQDFLVFINADTGKEEDILLIIDTPNGVLTM